MKYKPRKPGDIRGGQERFITGGGGGGIGTKGNQTKQGKKLKNLTKRYIEIVKKGDSSKLDRNAGPSKYAQRLSRVENSAVKSLAKKTLKTKIH